MCSFQPRCGNKVLQAKSKTGKSEAANTLGAKTEAKEAMVVENSWFPVTLIRNTFMSRAKSWDIKQCAE
jgi:hypothetical protein